MQMFKKLSVWRKSHELALRIFAVTTPFLERREAALASTLRRLVISIPTSIAEGSGRSTSTHFAHFLHCAIGSAHQLEYHLLLVRDLGLISPSEHATLEARTDQITKMLVALHKTVASRTKPPPATKRRPPSAI